MAARLAEACGHPSHAFWPQEISLLQEGLIRWERILGPRQITDAYLLALAVAHGGRLNRGRRRERSADARSLHGGRAGSGQIGIGEHALHNQIHINTEQ